MFDWIVKTCVQKTQEPHRCFFFFFFFFFVGQAPHGNVAWLWLWIFALIMSHSFPNYST
jgi:hypothetical protein